MPPFYNQPLPAPFELPGSTMLRFALVALLGTLSPLMACATAENSANLAAAAAPVHVPAPIRFLISFDDGPSGDRVNNSTEQVLDVLA
ncbi:MAG TPA: hypothetical protein VF798_08870, partial [Burkholderiaceae bacterium]